MIEYEDEKLLMEVKKKVLNAIDKVFKKYNIDRAYFEFTLTTKIYSIGFTEAHNEVVFDERKKYNCAFCDTPTTFYYDDMHVFLCPDCYRRLKK